jgi:hypothetical protein
LSNTSSERGLWSDTNGWLCERQTGVTHAKIHRPNHEIRGVFVRTASSRFTPTVESSPWLCPIGIPDAVKLLCFAFSGKCRRKLAARLATGETFRHWFF